MIIDRIPIGKNPPYDVNVIIEIPIGGVPVKYELDKAKLNPSLSANMQMC